MTVLQIIYTGFISIGTPKNNNEEPTKYSVLFDTGYGDLALINTFRSNKLAKYNILYIHNFPT